MNMNRRSMLSALLGLTAAPAVKPVSVYYGAGQAGARVLAKVYANSTYGKYIVTCDYVSAYPQSLVAEAAKNG